MTTAHDLFDVSGDDAVLRLHVLPGAGRTAVVGRHGDALKVRVAAPPERGRANEACLDLVASLVGVGRDAVSLSAGDSSRTKRVRIAGIDPDELAALLETALHQADLLPGGASSQPDLRGRNR